MRSSLVIIHTYSINYRSLFFQRQQISMKVILLYAVLLAVCLLGTQGKLSELAQDFVSGELDLHNALRTSATNSIFTIPESISTDDRLLLTIRYASIRTDSFGKKKLNIASLEVVPLENSNAVELRIQPESVSQIWKVKISYIIINWSSLQSAVTIHTVNLASLPLHRILEGGMQIIAHQINQMNGEQTLYSSEKQMVVLLAGFTVKVEGKRGDSMARFMGGVNGMKISLFVEMNEIESCLLYLIVIEKAKLAYLGLRIEIIFNYFPMTTSSFSSQTQILNELQIENTCRYNSLAIEKDCWSMRSLSRFQLIPIGQSAQPVHPVVEYSKRNLGCSFSPCTCTDSRATACIAGLICSNCYVTRCIAGYYAPFFSKVCKVCPVIPNCNGCRLENGQSTATCASCNSGYTSIGGVCVACPSGCTGCTTVVVSGIEKASCSGCSATLTQQAVGGVTSCGCLTNQYLSAGSCFDCPPECTTCSSPTACTGCVPGNYPSGGTCLPCMPVCKTCDSSTTCITCPSSLFALVGDVCVCNSPYLFDTNTKACVLCSSLQSNCATCSYSTAYSPSTPPSVVCVTASPGYFVALNGSTAACIPHCTNCTSNPLLCDIPNPGYSFDGTNCICDTDLYYSEGNCLPCTSIMPGCDSCNTNPIPNVTTCQVCSSLGYFNATAYPTTTCSPCAPLCTICNSLTDCSVCIHTLIPVGGICTCDSNASLYYDSITQDCLSCSLVIFNCQSCVSNGSTTVTCSSCGLGRYLATGGLSCASCPIQCSECLNSSYCSNCRSGYDLVNNTCICGPSCTDCMTNSTDQLCSNCTFGPFFCNGCLGGYLINSNGTCSPCSSTFTACTECTATDCMACAVPFVLTPSGCQCNNTAGMYLSSNGSTCLPCGMAISGCIECTNSGPTTPTTCVSPAIGFFIDFGGRSCGACSGFCRTCSMNATYCGSCLPTYTMVTNGSCGCNSTNAQFYNPVIQGCSSCSILLPNCLNCTTSAFNTSCLQCASKMYWDSVDFACQQCPSSCLQCSSPTTCTTCPKDFVLSQTLPGWTVAGQCVCNTTNTAAPFYDAVTKTCKGCSYFYPSCLACINSSSTPICSICSEGTYLAYDSCVNCPSSCASCSSPTTCTSCPGNLTLSGGSCICDSACNQCQLLSVGCVSCTISSGAITACLACESGLYLSSPNCIACPSACATCTSPTQCLTCQPTYRLSNGVCFCPTSLGIFPNSASQCALCADIYYGCTDCSMNSGNTTCLDCIAGYYLSGGQCLTCSSSCMSCSITAGNCTGCVAGMILTNGTCLCSDAACIACNATSPNCAQCIYTVIGTFSQCASCQPGFYLSGSSCTICPSGCLTCGAYGACLTCPNTFQVISGRCECNSAQALWESAGQCLACTTLYPNCQTCLHNTSISLNVSCSACLFGYYAFNNSCVVSVCGDGAITSGQNCDDGNTLNNDGCSQYCQLEANFLCSGQPSICTVNLNYHIIFSSLTTSLTICNQISVSFLMDPVYSAYDNANFGNMLSYADNPNIVYVSWTYSAGIVSYTFNYTETLDNQTAVFYFAPKNLAINQTSNVPVITVTVPLLSDNNLAIVYYPLEVCESKESIRELTTAVQYASYGTLAVSALPCKIVGLELFGVLQLAFLSTGNMDNVNTMLTPLMGMKGVQGFALNLGQESKQRLLQGSFTPSRVQSIGYEANFLRNCNIMLAIVVAVIIVAIFLYALTYCCRSCAPSLHKFAKRMLKEVLLTLILFNCFNFGYSAGIHFNYAPKDDSLYDAGTAAAVLALILPVLMALALMCTEDTGFGEFKEKFKPGVVQRLYFVVTILYRSGIGLYVSTMNQDQMSSLIVMALSIAFLLYNLVNLPYAQAIHNYRANICHFAQAICLFVTMYYRSMMSSSTAAEVASIHKPAYLEIAAILISLIMSLVVLIYQVYLFIKECCFDSSKIKVKSQNIMVTENQDCTNPNLDEKENNNQFSIEFVDLE